MGNEWFYSRDGTQCGPVSVEALKDLVQQGTVTRDTLVWREGFPAWTPAGQVAELFAAPPPLPTAQPARPAPPPLPPQVPAAQQSQSRTTRFGFEDAPAAQRGGPQPPAPPQGHSAGINRPVSQASPVPAASARTEARPIQPQAQRKVPPPRQSQGSSIKKYMLLGCGGLLFIFVTFAVIVPNILRSDAKLNEASAIAACSMIDEAQQMYAMTDYDGDGVREFAATLTGDDSLWESTAGSGDRILVSESIANAGRSLGDPRRAPHAGYIFKILTEQGPKAPAGSYSYFLNGNLMLGYAVLAYPEQYGSSGKKSFLISAAGQVWERDLGPETGPTCEAMTRFNPLDGWDEIRAKVRVSGYLRAVWGMNVRQVELANHEGAKLVKTQTQTVKRIGDFDIYAPADTGRSDTAESRSTTEYYFSTSSPQELNAVRYSFELLNGAGDPIVTNKVKETMVQQAIYELGEPTTRNPSAGQYEWKFQNGSFAMFATLRDGNSTYFTLNYFSPAWHGR